MMLIEQNFIIVVSVAKTTYMSKGAGFVDPVFGKPRNCHGQQRFLLDVPSKWISITLCLRLI